MKSERLALAVALLLGFVFFLQGFFGSLHKSLTYDEGSFIASGYVYLTRSDFRVNAEAPPLLQELAALPLLVWKPQFSAEAEQAIEARDSFGLGRHLLYGTGLDIQKVALWARLPFLLMGAGLVVCLFFLGRTLAGPAAGLVAASLAAFEPNLLAHAKVATTDLGCAFFMLLAIWSFWRAWQGGCWRDVLACGLLTGFALLAKYTSLLLGPIFLVLAVGAWSMRAPGLRLHQLALRVAAAAGLAVAAVAGGYHLSFGLPLYMAGLSRVYANHNPDYQFYFLGMLSAEPWWYYHIVALLLKTPLPVLLLVTLAFIRALRGKIPPQAVLVALVPAFVVLGVSCFDRSNIGLRRVLPALPFFCLLAGLVVAGDTMWIMRYTVAGLLAWSLWEAAAIYPHHLAYFNAAAGGPLRGPHLLDDSNIDWGQDLPALADWQRLHAGREPLRLWYFGTALPEAYGVSWQAIARQDLVTPQPGVYAVSVQNLINLRRIRGNTNLDIDWLTKYQPVARVGYSIFIYRFPGSEIVSGETGGH